jgi:uncharacterized protein (TIRG00374 family)
MIINKKTYLKILFSLSLLFLIFQKIELGKFLFFIKKTNFLTYLKNFSLVIIFTLLSTIRLYKLTKEINKNLNLKFIKLLKGVLIGYFYNLFLPTTIGGDVAKGIYISDKKISKKSGVVISFIDRTAGLMGLAAVGLFGTLFLNEYYFPIPRIFMTFFFSLIIIFIFVFFYFFDFFKRRLLGNKTFKFLNFLKELNFSQRAVFLKLAFFSFFLQIVNVFTHFSVANSVGINLPFAYFFTAVPLLSLIVLLPITINGIGLREISAVSLYSAVGISSPQILAYTTIIFSYSVALGIIGGIIQSHTLFNKIIK